MKVIPASSKHLVWPGLILMIMAASMTIGVFGQSASDYVAKANMARSNLDFAAAFEYANSAVNADSNYWPAYLARAENRYYRDRKRGIGVESDADKAEWRMILDDHLKAADLSRQTFQPYDKLILFLVFMRETGPPEKPAVKLGNDLIVRADAFYETQIATNSHNVCAYYAQGFFRDLAGKRKPYQAAIDQFDGSNGRKCSAEAAASMAKALLNNPESLAEARQYYATAKRIDDSVSFTESDAFALTGVGSKPAPITTAKQPVQPPTSTPAPSAPAPDVPEWWDRFQADFLTLSNDFRTAKREYDAAMKTLQKAINDDAKYGMSLSGMYTGTRRKAQTSLDEMHRLLRGFIARWSHLPANDVIDQVRQWEREAPDKVP